MFKLSQATLKKEAQCAIRNGIKNLLEQVRKRSTMSEFKLELSKAEAESEAMYGKVDKLDCMLQAVRQLANTYQYIATNLHSIHSWVATQDGYVLTVQDLEDLHHALDGLPSLFCQTPPSSILEPAKSTSVPDDVVPEPTDAE